MEEMQENVTFSSFAGEELVVTGPLRTMLLETKERLDHRPEEPILIFEDATGRQVDFDFRGTAEEVVARAMPEAPKAGPGRPKLGVLSREVSLLPRHWEWLESQPSGISAAIRRLVDEARKRAPDEDRARLAREAASRFMTAMAGNLPGYEEASRALFAKDQARFAELVADWPKDIRATALRLAGAPG